MIFEEETDYKDSVAAYISILQALPSLESKYSPHRFGYASLHILSSYIFTDVHFSAT